MIDVAVVLERMEALEKRMQQRMQRFEVQQELVIAQIKELGAQLGRLVERHNRLPGE